MSETSRNTVSKTTKKKNTKKETTVTTATKRKTTVSNLDLILAVERDLNTLLLEREEEVRSMMLALLAKQHLFQLGPPGVGKSLLATEVCDRISGAARFDYLMSRFTTPEEIFGPPSLKALRERDIYERNGSGMLQEAEIAFLDEIWKANSAILNTLLPILNERLYREAGRARSVPLETMVCASNEMPQGEDLGAVFDRILLRHVVQDLSPAGVRRLLLNPPRVDKPATITRAQLAAAQEEAARVTVTDEVVDLILTLRNDLASIRGVSPSPRRWKATLTVVKAQAWLAGRDTTQAEDLLPLVHCLWSDPEHRSAVEIAVINVAAPALREIRDFLDVAHEMVRAHSSSDDENVRVESFLKLRKAEARSKALAQNAGEAGRKIADKIKAMVEDAKELDQRRTAARYGADDLFEEVV